MKNNIFNDLKYHEISNKTVRAAFVSVCKTKKFNELEFKNKTTTISKISKTINKNQRKITNNTQFLRTQSTKRFKTNKFSIYFDDLLNTDMKNAVILKDYYDFYAEKPPILYKFIKYEYAIESVNESYIHCGTSSSYRKDDHNEMKIILPRNEDNKNDFEEIITEVMSELLTNKKINIDKKIDEVDRHIGQFYYIGCLTDHNCDKEYMWNKYGTLGICIIIDSSPIKAYKVTYDDNPTPNNVVQDNFKDICKKIWTASRNDVKKSFDDMLNTNSVIGLLNLYRKDTYFKKESEWRIIVPKTEIVHGKYPVKILKVISWLPEEKDNELKKICAEKNIIYERRENY